MGQHWPGGHRSVPGREAATLALALVTWPWPPSFPFLRACLLEVYAELGLAAEAPVLDLACGDGRFAQALVERGVILRIDAALERSPADAAAARRSGVPVVLGDLSALPFADRAAGTVLCNTALNCLWGGPAALPGVLGEIHRVLRPGGRIVASMHVRAHDQLLTGVRLLRGLGLGKAARRYAERVNRENGRTIHLEPEDWRKALEAAGFVVERTRPLVDARAMRARSLLRLVKFVRPRGLARLVTRRLLTGLMAPLIDAVPQEGEPTAFLVLVARRRD